MGPEHVDLSVPQSEDQSGFATALSIFFALSVGVLFALMLVIALTFLW